LSEHEVRALVEAVEDPRFLHTIGELGMVASVHPRWRSTEVEIALPVPDYGPTSELVSRIGAAVAAAGAPAARVGSRLMSDDERAILAHRLRELDSPDGGERPDGASANPFTDSSSTTRVLAVSSGKGGVGKSSVTVNVAVALARAGHSVALLDADVYGFSVPRMLGVVEPPLIVGDVLVPPVAHGLRCMSMGFFVDDDQPVVWRGPMLHKALEQFLTDVHWGRPEFLLVDMPPGTGDVALSMSQFLPRAELFVVTTPQPAARRVAQRSAFMARQLKLPLRGVIENMSWFRGDDGKRYELFGSGGGEALASALGVPLLAQVPFVPAVREGGDEGSPVTATQPAGEAGVAFADLAERIVSIGPSRVYRRELSVR
jgi:ATP-binding protein involved in chromosome partitioning